ncbi:MAG: hypothetical protein U1A27_11785 [Phycisphaerae bacterium]
MTGRGRKIWKIVAAIAWAAVLAGCAVRWDLDYNYARGVAQQQKRLMLLYFKDWSSPDHRNLVTQVFQSPVVAKELKDTINVEMLYNWGPTAAQYGVEKEPQVCVMCNPDGNEIGRMGVRNPIPSPEKFAEWVRQMKAAARPASQPVAAPGGKAPAPSGKAPVAGPRR